MTYKIWEVKKPNIRREGKKNTSQLQTKKSRNQTLGAHNWLGKARG